MIWFPTFQAKWRATGIIKQRKSGQSKKKSSCDMDMVYVVSLTGFVQVPAEKRMFGCCKGTDFESWRIEVASNVAT